MANSEIIGAGQDTAHRAPKTNTITCGDCLEVMQAIPNNSVNMVLCDLPYGITAPKWDSVLPIPTLWNEYKRILKKNSVMVFTSVQPFTTMLISSNLNEFKYCWYWIKNQGTNFFHAKRMPIRKVEDIVVFGGNRYYPQITSGHIPTNSAKGCSNGKAYHGTNKRNYQGGKTTRFPVNILEIDCVDNYSRVHSSEKPVALFEYLIRTYTNECDTVLDNCIGSGTTAIACINTGRNYVGIEKEEKYCRIAEERIHALKSPAQNTMEICHTAPNSAMLQGLKPHAGNTGTSA